MKKRMIILLGVATVLSFASCSNSNKQGSYTKEQMDSIFNHRQDSIANAAKLKNDSIAAAKAQAEAAKQSKPEANNKAEKIIAPKAPIKKANNATATVAKETHHVRTQKEIEADKKAALFGDKAAEERLKQDEALKKKALFGDSAAKAELKAREAQKKADLFKKQH